MNAILDASAILAYLYREPGQDMVIQAISNGASLCTGNLAEVAGRLTRDGTPADKVRQVIENLPVELVELDADLALRAGLMEATTRSAGLSLGDRICLALAAREGLPALTTDRVWMTIADAVGVRATLIR